MTSPAIPDPDSPEQHLRDGVANYLGSLPDDEYRALLAAARPPSEEQAPATGSRGAAEAARRFGGQR